MSRRVEGIYASVDEAVTAVERLKKQGYSSNEISLVANSQVRNTIPYTTVGDVSIDAGQTGQDGDDNRSFWEKVKGAFTLDDTYDTSVYDDPSYDTTQDPLYAHRDEISRGHIVVLVDDATAAGQRTAATHNDTTSETIQLQEEHLGVNTQEVQTGEVRVGKRVVEETETVDVPVTHEEVTIERRPVTGGKVVPGDIDATESEKEIVIPVTEEQVNVDKQTEVVEEVGIQKEKVTEEKQVTDTVKREELDVETDGSIRVDEDQTRTDRRI